MSIHIGAEFGQIAETVFIPGDPLRAKWIDENYLQNSFCYSKTRNMLGFTGTYKGKRVSVQGGGMGMASNGIYIDELIKVYGVKNIIRVGSAGSLQTDINCRDIVLAIGACSDSAMNLRRFGAGLSFAPVADWDLLLKAHNVAKEKKIPVKIGNIFSTDRFYDSDDWKIFAKYGAIAIEMETAELYTLAAKSNVKALTILTISDSLIFKTSLSSEERENSFSQMMEIALSII